MFSTGIPNTQSKNKAKPEVTMPIKVFSSKYLRCKKNYVYNIEINLNSTDKSNASQAYQIQ